MNDIEKDTNHPYRDLLTKVETVMLVDSPQLGTPQAIASILHGIGENLPFEILNFMSNAQVGRSTAQNMPSAYALLPSRDYAARVVDNGSEHTTLIELDQSLNKIKNDTLFTASGTLEYFTSHYGTTTIATYSALTDFLLGKDAHLSAPDNDLEHPKVL